MQFNQTIEILQIEENKFVGDKGQNVEFFRITFLDESSNVLRVNSIDKEKAEELKKYIRKPFNATFLLSQTPAGLTKIKLK